MAALETTPTQTNPDHPIRPAALVCRSDEICRSVGLRFEDGLSDGLSDGRSVSHTGLWPVNVAKPLMSRLLVENTNKATSSADSGTGNGIRRSDLLSQDCIVARSYALATPSVSREVRAALKDFDPQKHSTTTQRILFRKVSKPTTRKTGN
jgi:hypothetical protein